MSDLYVRDLIAARIKAGKDGENAMEMAVLAGMDAMRICLGMKPKNFTKAGVVEWMDTVTAAANRTSP